MLKPVVTTIASLSLLIANVAIAAPGSAALPNRPCPHCAQSGAMATPVANTRGASLSKGERRCHHDHITVSRWGAAQQPCPHCTHTA